MIIKISINSSLNVDLLFLITMFKSDILLIQLINSKLAVLKNKLCKISQNITIQSKTNSPTCSRTNSVWLPSHSTRCKTV